MKQPIYKLLGSTEKDFDNLILRIMITWAQIYAKDCTERTQQLLSNRIINNWFRKEFSKLVLEFREHLEPYKNQSSIDERRKLFTNTVTKIYEIYPSALMIEYKIPQKLTINTKNFSNN